MGSRRNGCIPDKSALKAIFRRARHPPRLCHGGLQPASAWRRSSPGAAAGCRMQPAALPPPVRLLRRRIGRRGPCRCASTHACSATCLPPSSCPPSPRSGPAGRWSWAGSTAPTPPWTRSSASRGRMPRSPANCRPRCTTPPRRRRRTRARCSSAAGTPGPAARASCASRGTVPGSRRSARCPSRPPTSPPRESGGRSTSSVGTRVASRWTRSSASTPAARRTSSHTCRTRCATPRSRRPAGAW